MTRTRAPDAQALNRLGRMIAACERFEAAWQEGQEPLIEACLAEAEEAERPELARELLALELELRRRRGEWPSPESYRARFPGYTTQVEEAFAPGALAPEGDGHAGQTLTMIPPEPGANSETSEVVRAMGGWTSFGRRFRIVRPHAMGNLGEVFVASDAELHREVALKEIRSYHAHVPESRARFLLEAEITGRLEHPGIVPVYALGYYGDGRPYYAMRLIRGESLKEAIVRFHAAEEPRREPGERALALRQLLGRFIAVCDALAYAHSRGILHRDLKPSNIMLGPYGETLVVDWGLAKPIGRPEGLEQALEGTLRPATADGVADSQAGSVHGTPAYMSPEQADERREDPLGPAADIYSLGATLYSILTGHAPFEGGDLKRVLEQVRAGSFPKPRAVNPGVPPALEAICLKAMALRADERYETPRALADDVERWLADEPVRAYREPLMIRASRWVRGHKPLVAGVAAMLVASVIGLTVDHFRIRRERARVEQARQNAVAARDQAKANYKVARAAVDQILARVAGSDLAYRPQTDKLRLELAGKALGFYQNLHALHPSDPGARVALAGAYRTTASIGRLAGQLDEPRAEYREAIRLLEGLVAEFPARDGYREEQSQTLIDLGELLRMNGQPRAAEERYRAALALVERLRSRSPDAVRYRQAQAAGLLNLAEAEIETGRFADARQSSEQAVALLTPLADADRPLPMNRLLLVYALPNLGVALRGEKDIKKAEDVLIQAVRRARALEVDWPNPDSRFALALASDELGRLLAEIPQRRPEALSAFDESVKLLTPLTRQHPYTPHYRGELAVALNGRGGCYLADGKLTAAEADCTTARTRLESLLNPPRAQPTEWSQLGRTLANLGRIAAAKGKPAEAQSLFRQAIQRHQAARTANPESPEDRELAERRRAELEQVRSKSEAPRPSP